MPHRPVILIVEDEESIRLLLEEFLILEGYRPIGAYNGQDALEHIRQLQATEQRFPNLIISDYMMPVMNGLQLAKHLQAAGLLKRTSFVLITALPSVAQLEAEAEAEAAGNEGDTLLPFFTVVIPKPFDLDELATTIKALLAQNQNQNQPPQAK